MIFTTQVFLFVFFPLCLLIYTVLVRIEKLTKNTFLEKTQAKDIALIAFSLAFYMWTCFHNLFWLLFYILAVHFVARLMESFKKKRLFINVYSESEAANQSTYKSIYLAIIPYLIGVLALVFLLIYYKYSEFLAQIWNGMFNVSITPKSILAPIGLSFITFSAISYLSDIYHGKASAGSFIDCALYLSFFPKVVSGPIVLWRDFQHQIKNRNLSLDLLTDGLNRIMIGFSKKILLADTFGACLAKINLSNMDRVTAIGSLVLYTLQIYYDFSGYSDIAIGLSKLFGFQFEENFNFPYRSKSISEFWRRWHISLGRWFREYVYFPLGGSRVEAHKVLRNLAIVFALTGIWHGAGWNYVIWGLINGTLVILERIIQKKTFYQKIPNFIKHGLTMLIVTMFWQLFRYQTIKEIVTLFRIITGSIRFETIFYTWQYYFDTQIIVFSIMGIIGSTFLGAPKIQSYYKKISSIKSFFLFQEVVLLTLFALSVLFMINSTYSPFIYFQY